MVSPINLWSRPIQVEYEEALYHESLAKAVYLSDKKELKFRKRKAEEASKRVSDLAFIYYTRTGKFPDGFKPSSQ